MCIRLVPGGKSRLAVGSFVIVWLVLALCQLDGVDSASPVQAEKYGLKSFAHPGHSTRKFPSSVGGSCPCSRMYS